MLSIARFARCRRCRYFDLDAGQKEMHDDPRVRLLVESLSPMELASVERTGRPDKGARLQAHLKGERVSWRDYGACHFHRELRIDADFCPSWRPMFRDVAALCGSVALLFALLFILLRAC